jgi:hypothetical protein
MARGPNQPTTAHPETPLQELAYEAHIRMVHEAARASAQAAILINGGAATAVLAYLAKETATPVNMVSAASLSLKLYAAGVFLGTLSMWCSGQAAARFAYMWEAFLDKDERGRNAFIRKGSWWWVYGHQGSFVLSILLFLIASWLMARGFFASVK